MMGRFGMGVKWRAWIKECVFKVDLSILVNGSPTEEMSIQKGLKQGDPLAPFLFLLVAEGLAGLMRNAVSLGIFKGFKIWNEEEVISILQYANDTLLVGEATWSNLWATKSILRCFEMVSGLKVKFHKSRVIGVNVDNIFLNDATIFLSFKRGGVPFKYFIRC